MDKAFLRYTQTHNLVSFYVAIQLSMDKAFLLATQPLVKSEYTGRNPTFNGQSISAVSTSYANIKLYESQSNFQWTKHFCERVSLYHFFERHNEVAIQLSMDKAFLLPTKKHYLLGDKSQSNFQWTKHFCDIQ